MNRRIIPTGTPSDVRHIDFQTGEQTGHERHEADGSFSLARSPYSDTYDVEIAPLETPLSRTRRIVIATGVALGGLTLIGAAWASAHEAAHAADHAPEAIPTCDIPATPVRNPGHMQVCENPDGSLLYVPAP